MAACVGFFVTAVMVALVAGAVVYGAKFKSTWKAPDVDRLNFAGKKVAAVVISDDQDLQVSAEEELARRVDRARGAGRALLPADAARGDGRQGQGQGMVRAVRREPALSSCGLCRRTRKSRYTPDLWVTTIYANPWDYYAYGYGTAIGGINRREDIVVTIETLLFNWRGTSSCGPASARRPTQGRAEGRQGTGRGLVSEMRKEGLVPKGTP